MTADQKADKCYDKLFYGNNLPSVTPPGEHYSPHFDDHEQRVIHEILDRGRVILASHLYLQSPQPEQEAPHSK